MRPHWHGAIRWKANHNESSQMKLNFELSLKKKIKIKCWHKKWSRYYGAPLRSNAAATSKSLVALFFKNMKQSSVWALVQVEF